jgi:Zn-dependent protease with chaperone function
MTHPGLLYDGEHARPLPVTWIVTGEQLAITGDGSEFHVPVAQLVATSRLGNVRRAIHLPDGRQLHCDDNDAVDRLFRPRGIEVLTDRLERHPAAVAVSLLGTIAAVLLFFTVGLPALAARVAAAIPPETEQAMGRQVLAALDRTSLSASTLDEDDQAYYREVFGRFTADLPGADRYQLEFRYLDGYGANAFALPGGAIVVTDALMEMFGYDEEFLAIIAHEIGHHEQRHAMRSVLQQSAVAVLAAAFTGDVSAATTATVAVPTFLLNNHYSRDFESEADGWAFGQLAAAGISPAWFARIMARMEEGEGGDAATEASSDSGADALAWASTHPPTPERIAQALGAQGDLPSPGELIVAREVVRMAREERAALEESRAGGDAPVLARSDLVGCWEGVEDDDSKSSWRQRTSEDGTLTQRLEFRSDDGTTTSARQGFWAQEDNSLVEYSYDPAANAGLGSAAGDTSWYRLTTVEPDYMVYEDIDRTYEAAARRISCPAGL